MGITCHRCGGDLPGDEVRGFCPTCGAPQLRVVAGTGEDDRATETTNALPPPRPQQIVWPVALQCSATVAGATAIAFAATVAVPILGLAGLVLLFGASFLAVGLYRRRSPGAMMNPTVGAKIGLSTGILLTAGLMATMAILLVVARFHTHSMDSFDAQWAEQTAVLLERTKASSPVPPEAEQQMATPEFRAGSMLAGLATFGGFLLAISAGSGAFAGSITERPQPRA